MPSPMEDMPEALATVLARNPAMLRNGAFVEYLASALCPVVSSENPPPLEVALVDALHAQFRGLKDAEERIRQLGGAIDKLTAAPWQTATFLKTFNWPDDVTRALVAQGGRQSVVEIVEGLDPGTLAMGDGVLLAQAGNIILTKAPMRLQTGGETAAFRRALPDGRLVLEHRDTELVVEAGASLRPDELAEGDLVVFDRALWLAVERVERPARKRHQLEPAMLEGVTRAQIGGQDEVVRRFFDALLLLSGDSDVARRYALGDQRVAILLYGPPGNGKTTLARIGAAELQRRLGRKVSLFIVQPSEWTDPYVGQTEANIRRFFADVREAGESGFVLVYLDEIEAIGRARGSSGSTGHHHDRFLAAFLAELDGFTALKNVGVIASTNRPDLLDRGLRDRLNDLQIEVGPPALAGARAIFAIHLPDGILFRPNGADAADTRLDAIETAVSLIYGPNADNEVCTVKLADGRERHVHAHELISGRTIAQICRAARRRALVRHLGGGEPGITVADVEAEVRNAIDTMRSTVTVFNTHSYVPDLPRDVAVADVRPVARRVVRPPLRSAAA